MKLVEIDRKSRVLTRARFGCLRNAHTLNLTQGCEFACAYCYARGYPDAPAAGQVYLYRNLAAKLSAELDNPRRRTVVDRVVFNTASDSFQTHPAILDLAYRTMQVLLERCVGFSFLTKGWIPDRFVRLFSNRPDLITARIGLVSMDPRYRDLFEPGTATATRRLENIDRLQDAGVTVDVRIDPIIPFYTDDADSIRRLYEVLAERKIKTVSLSYLHLRPAILAQLQRELPPTAFNVLGSCFAAKAWSVVGSSTRSKLVPLSLRRKGYRRFNRLAAEYEITTLICACKNPDMPGQLCVRRTRIDGPDKKRKQRAKQLTLFSCFHNE